MSENGNGRIYHKLMITDIGGQKKYKFQIKLIYNLLQGANLVVNVIDGNNFNDSVNYINSISKSTENFNNIYVVTKKDLEDEDLNENIDNLEKLIKNPVIAISNLTGENIDKLTDVIKEIISNPHNYFPKNAEKTQRISKVVFSGLGGVGKTTLLYRLKTGKFIEDTKLTIGSNIESVELVYTLDNKPKSLALFKADGNE